jgi:hypothetical protein
MEEGHKRAQQVLVVTVRRAIRHTAVTARVAILVAVGSCVYI